MKTLASLEVCGSGEDEIYFNHLYLSSIFCSTLNSSPLSAHQSSSLVFEGQTHSGAVGDHFAFFALHVQLCNFIATTSF